MTVLRRAHRTARRPALTAALVVALPTLLSTAVVLPAPAVAAPATVAPAGTARVALPRAAVSLGTSVAVALRSSGARTVGADVHVGGVGTVLRREAGHPLPPASTQKSFVVAAALLALPPTTRLTTEVAVATTTVTTGVLPGPLWLVGGGDPYLSTVGMRELARSVRAAGVTEVLGDLRLDDSRYDAARRAPGWRASYVPSQVGPLSALALDRNRWRRDAAFLADPALPAAARFRDLLLAEGVVVRGRVVRGPRPADAVTLASRSSSPLPLHAARLLKASDNFAAELLLKEVGRTVRGDGSTGGGLRAVRDVLGARGVPFSATGDGSGLSARARQTPAAGVALLRAMDVSPVAGAFRAALPVACVDGTLRQRMCRTPAAGNAAAKTGTLSGVRALSGYVRTSSGRTITFTFQLTGVTDSARARAGLDRATALLAGSAV